MKKILILTIALVSLFSCSSDDEKSLDPIVGSWYKFSNNGKETSECTRKGTFNFKENGNFLFTNYYIDSKNNCKKEEDDSGTWVNKGNGVYSTTTGSKSSDANVVFSNNNNTLTTTFASEEEEKKEVIIYKRK